ncbi:MAG: MobA/MobL family protein, partial [Lachnospiraceae bacterium]|nr:MobA/MobL family protein [Lachnospiraceae bacterium]
MVEKTVSSRFKIVGRSMKCKGGHSVVEQSAYISRTTMKSEYDGRTYYPKYSEDLVHVEISLPEGAPEQYKDRSVLWNSVEMFEKRADAQYARTNRFPLPNDWSYETAVMVMRDYIQRNFVSKGMCCEWAIHDSENPKTGQRNLHCHIMLTMRPILE